MAVLAKLRADYRRHGRSPTNLAFWAVAIYRFGVWSHHLRFAPARWITSKLYGLLFFMIQVASGIELNREARIGDGLYLVHVGNIKVHPGTVIGERCTIFHDVTVGTNLDRDGAPTIGDDVYIGAGAKILGPVRIGDGARIAANSLVVADIPPGVTAIGVPARPMQFSGQRNPGPQLHREAEGSAK
jgi:serine O-acetyltransferase